MTLGEWASIVTIVAVGTTGAGAVGKLYGDTQWVPIGAYQQEKLEDLKDEAFEYELHKKYEGPLTPREQEAYDRLMRRIERLQDQIN